MFFDNYVRDLMREQVGDLHTDSVIVRRATPGTTTFDADHYPAMGTAALVTAGTVVGRLLIDRRSDTNAQIAMQEKGASTARLSVDWSADVRDGDTLNINNVVWEVQNRLADEQTDKADKQFLLVRVG